MSTPKAEVGSIGWIDLSVEDAPRVRDFYSKVVGWKPEDVDMGEYSDFNMTLASGVPAAGICHKKGTNAPIPSHWLIYITVADLERSVALCNELGGEVLVGPKGSDSFGHYCIIRDPAGAVCALFQPAATS